MQINWQTALSKVQAEALDTFMKNNAYSIAFERQDLVGLVHDESLRDTMIELHNYAGIAVVMMDEANALKNIAPGTDPDTDPGTDLASDLAYEMETVSLRENDYDSINVVNIRTFESQSSPGQYHTTKRLCNGYKCSCLGFGYRNWCSHCETMKSTHELIL